MMLPRYHEPLSLPLPALAGPGIVLAAARYERPGHGLSIRVAGEVLYAQDDGDALEVSLLQAISVVSLTETRPSHFIHLVTPVAGSHAVFQDDVERRGSLLRAVFELDLLAAKPHMRAQNRFWIHACCGPHLSAVVELGSLQTG